MDDQHASSSWEASGQPWNDLIAEVRAATRARVERRSEQALDEVREFRVRLSNDDEQLNAAMGRMEQAFAHGVARFHAEALGERGGVLMSETPELVPAAADSRPANELSGRHRGTPDEPTVSQLYDALKDLRELKESLSAIDRALEEAFSVIDRQFKRLRQREIAASYRQSRDKAP